MEKIFESQIKEIIIKLPTHEEIFNGCLTLRCNNLICNFLRQLQ